MEAGDLLAEDALLILRLPRRSLEELGISPAKSRIYGRSVIAFFHKIVEE